MSISGVPASRNAETGSGKGTGRRLWRRMFGLPSTGPGWGAAGLWVASVAFLFVLQSLLAAGHRGGDTFFSGSPWLYAALLLMGAFGIAAGAVAAWAVIRRGERSLLEILPFVWGLFWLYFAIGAIVDSI